MHFDLYIKSMYFPQPNFHKWQLRLNTRGCHSKKFSYTPKNLCQKSKKFKKNSKNPKNSDEKKREISGFLQKSQNKIKKNPKILKKSEQIQKIEFFFPIFGFKSSYTQM